MRLRSMLGWEGLRNRMPRARPGECREELLVGLADDIPLLAAAASFVGHDTPAPTWRLEDLDHNRRSVR